MLARSAYYSLEDLTIRHPDRHSIPYGSQDSQDTYKGKFNREGYYSPRETEDNPGRLSHTEDRPRRL